MEDVCIRKGHSWVWRRKRK